MLGSWKVDLFILIMLIRCLPISRVLCFSSGYSSCLSCYSGLCPVVCKRDVVSGVCCVARLVGTKRAKCTANTKREYVKRRQTRRQNILNERTQHNSVLHLLCCFNLFTAVHDSKQCLDDGNEIIHEDVSEASSNEKRDDMEDGVWEEPEYMVDNEEKEYRQVCGLCVDPTVDASDDDYQEQPLSANVPGNIVVG